MIILALVLLLCSPCLAQVSFSPAAGTYTGTQTVTITCSPPSGTSIWYRTDGLPATPTDTLYTGPVTVSASQTLTAVCANTGVSNNALTVGSADWKVNCPPSPSPQTSNGWTCASSGGVGTNPLSSFNLTFPSGTAVQNIQTTYSGSGDAQILYICCQQSGYVLTCNSCTTMDQHIAYTESPSPSAALENRENDMQMLVDAFTFTKVFAQFSFQCQGSSGKLEINASGSWNKITISCILTHGDWQVGGHIEANGTGNCTAANFGGTTPTYGCAVFDYIIDNLTHTYYGPISNYCTSGTICNTYPLQQQSSWSYFAASVQSQQDIFNTTTAGGSPSTDTSTITAYSSTATKGIVGSGSAAYTINSTVLAPGSPFWLASLHKISEN